MVTHEMNWLTCDVILVIFPDMVSIYDIRCIITSYYKARICSDKCDQIGGSKMSRAIIIYETSSGNTEKMAKAIVSGMEEAGVQVMLKRTMGTKVAELMDFDAVLIGSPTYHQNPLLAIKDFLIKMEGVNLKDKIGAAFGSYGWSGESIQMITDSMRDTFMMDVAGPGLRLKTGWSESSFQQCREFGKKIAEKVNSEGGQL